MADRSREPEDNIQLNRITGALEGMADEVRAVRQAGEAHAAKAEADRDAQRRAAAREAARRGQQQRGGAGRVLIAKPADVADAARVARAAAETERAEGRTAGHLQRQERSIEAAERVRLAAAARARAQAAQATAEPLSARTIRRPADIESDIRRQQEIADLYRQSAKLTHPERSSVVRGHQAELTRLRQELAEAQAAPQPVAKGTADAERAATATQTAAEDAERAARAERQRNETIARRSGLLLAERRGMRESISAEQRATERLERQRIEAARRRQTVEREIVRRAGVGGALVPAFSVARPERRSTIDEAERQRRQDARRAEEAQREEERRLRRQAERTALLHRQYAEAYRRGRLPAGAGAPPPPPPPPPPAPPGPPEPPDDDARRRLSDALRDPGRVAREAQQQATAAQDRNTQSTQQNAAVKRNAALSQADFTRSISRFNQEANASEAVYTRNGALTTEFLSAVARGQVTVRELGRQVGLTIGKFAGWTTAAAATYGMVRAVGVLGRGAVHGLDAVNKLERVVSGLDTNRAQQQLRDLAEQFNLPLDEVGEAAFGAGKIFKDQDDVFKGTESALFAVKVGELDAATATQALTAIINGLGEGVDSLAPIFDKINHLTNSFGGNVGQLTVGLAKSAGAFRNAGGDVDYLLSLLQTGARVTSYTSTEIGTALARTSERLQQPVRRKKVSELLGLSEDDAGNIVTVWERIFERIREGAGAQEIAQIMSTVSTPLLATRLLPIAKRESLFRDIHGATGPESEDSAAKELAKVMEAPSEQIKAAAIAFANLGSALSTSGALEPLLAIAKGVVGIIQGATELVELFSRLPGPLKTAAAFAGQLAAAIALMRRFDVGGVIDRQTGRGTFGLARRPRALERASIDQALSTERAFFQEQRHRYTTEGARVSFRGREALRAADALADTPEKVAQLSPEKHREYQRHVTAANRALDESTDLTQRAEQARREDVRLQRQQAGFRRRTRRRFFFFGPRQEIQDAARDEELSGYRTTSQERITTEKSAQIITTGGRPVADGARRAEAAQRQAARSTRDAARQANRLGVSGRALGTALSVGVIGLRNAGRGIRGARAGMSNLGSRMREYGRDLRESFGPLDLIIAASIAIAARSAENAKQIEDAKRLRQRIPDADEILRRSQRELKDDSLFDKAESAIADSLRYILPGVKTPFVPDIKTADEEANEAARKDLEFRRKTLIPAQEVRGELLSQTQIRQRLEENLRNADDDAERDAAIEQARRELAKSFLKTYKPKGRAGRAALGTTADIIRQAAAQIRDGERSLQERLDALQSAEEIEAFALPIQNRIRREGPGRARPGEAGRNVVELNAAAIRAREALAQLDPQTDQEKISELLDTADKLEQQIIQDADERLKDAIAAARTPREARAATDEFLTTIRGARSQRRDRVATLKARTDRQRAERARLEAEQRGALDQARRQGPLSSVLTPFVAPISPALAAPTSPRLPAGAPIRQPQTNVLARIRAALVERRRRIAELGANIRRDGAALEELRKQLGLSRSAFRALLLQVGGEQLERDKEKAQQDADRKIARTGDPLKIARIIAALMARKTALVRKAIREGFAVREDLLEAIAEQNAQLKDLAEAEIARGAAKRGAASSKALGKNPTGTDTAAQAMKDAKAALDDITSKGDLVDPNRFFDAQAAYFESQRSLQDAQEAAAEEAKQKAEEARQRQRELIEAQGRSAESKTDDPVKQAQIRADTARKLERFAQTPAERLNAQTDTRLAEKEVLQTKIQSRIDDIDFNLEFEKISRDQAITQLRALTKMAGVTKQIRRDILRKIKSLQEGEDEGQLDLRVADIKLPTSYEVRRALGEAAIQGRGAPAVTAQQASMLRTSAGVVNTGGNTINITINDPAAAAQVYDALDRHGIGPGKAAARAAGRR